jgi:glutamate-1-semialdehyde 2,1-aminomutase
MSATALSNSRIEAAYREKTRESARLAAEAAECLPSGVTHDSRYLRPYGIYAERAEGARKWDLDGNVYVDFFGGHGALLLGHNHPEVLAAMRAALEQGTHFGANHALEVRWAQAVKDLVPCAEKLRFTASGTEATHLALRLARAHSGRDKLIRFMTHFHGWHDHMTSGYHSHFDGAPTAGVVPGVADSIILLPPGDIDAVRAALAAHDDVAAVILEPTGGSFGMVPHDDGFLGALREATAAAGVLLIFDEVITGFRVSPGGAQAHYGVTPDLATYAKILAGGLPGGAVAGRRDILDGLDFAAARKSGREKVDHPGTFNANPVSAAAGVAALGIVGTTDACARAHRSAAALRGRLNAALAAQAVPWAVYGNFSGIQIFTNPGNLAIDPNDFDPLDHSFKVLKESRPELVHKLRLAMMVNGVDFAPWPGGMTSAAHDEADLDLTVAAFEESLAMLKREGEL